MRMVTGFAGLLLAGAAVLGASGVAGAQDEPEPRQGAVPDISISLPASGCGAGTNLIALPLTLMTGQGIC
ncbi:hypothetical protein [Streptomyces palmae]|uniref:Chaplin n=1 Tax=Streptomyces palmae TaxID=1701085 RepID=A0A4Z0GQ04_9ACTN|nr:hypothetical protein [Streptomyces palmae]TGA98054.1 hypothetical protein E4099_23185 [Streptomyces palmae]